MHKPIKKLRGVALALGLALLGESVPAASLAGAPSTAELTAQARAAGNRKSEAVKIGRVLFKTIWPVQIMRVRVDGFGNHEIAGLMLSAVKFHENLDRAGFINEVELLVQRTLAASGVEEVDVWATVPILALKPGEPVSGDLAQPTQRTVFAFTCRRDQAGGLAAHLRNGVGVYWSPDFRDELRGH